MAYKTNCIICEMFHHKIVEMEETNDGFVCPECGKFYRKLTPEEEQQRKLKKLQQEASKPHCPYCNSTNLERITALGRMVSVGTLGLASNKMGKNFKCKNCKATF